MPIQFTFTSKCILKNYNLNSIHVKPSTKKELLKKKETYVVVFHHEHVVIVK